MMVTVLNLLDTREMITKGRDDDDFYFEESDSDGSVIATYHVWHHMSIYPPQQQKSGFKKYNLGGDAIESETWID